MNNSFVYGGMLVLFDKLVGWFFYDENGNKWSFDDKESIKSFINRKIIQE
jgi:phage pi2 protein 07